MDDSRERELLVVEVGPNLRDERQAKDAPLWYHNRWEAGMGQEVDISHSKGVENKRVDAPPWYHALVERSKEQVDNHRGNMGLKEETVAITPC